VPKKMHVFIPRSKTPTNLLGAIKMFTNIIETCLPKLNLLLRNNKTWMKHKGWKEKESTHEHDHSKHGLLNLRTHCEVKKWDVVKFIVVVT
jgi:hypothetical protein